MRIRLIGLVVGALGSLAFACTSAAPDPYAVPSGYCSAYAQAICQIGSTCQFDVGACETYQSTQCDANAAQAVGAGRTYTPGNVQTCINALNSAYGGSPSTISATTVSAYTATCDMVFVGSAATGAACQTDGDCRVAGEICATAPGQTAKCEVPTQKTLGAQCLDVGDQCPTDDYCDAEQGSPTYGTCIPAQSTGAACSATQPCEGDDSCVSGLCQPLGTSGQVCSNSSNCASGLFCDTYTDNTPGTTTPACVSEYTFARGAVDCLGIEGLSTHGTVPEAGVPDDASGD